ncbi:MAG: hypothetical protein VKL20_02470 [Synechocystis sp.]|nr:hypothetical protein [Synechocystis sp.]
MSQNFDLDDDLLPEYDFTKMTVVAKGPGRKPRALQVDIEPDVAALFPNAEAVNEGLRLLIRLIAKNSPLPTTAEMLMSSKD